MNFGSIRVRIAVLVTAAFALILIPASLGFVAWFENQLEAEVRNDDAEELGRQTELMKVIAEIATIDPTITTDDLLDTDGDLGIIALIPDDGTTLTILGPDGAVLTNSNESLEIFLSSDSEDPEGLPDEPGTDVPLLTADEIAVALDQTAAFYQRVIEELSPESQVEFAPILRFLEEQARLIPNTEDLDPPNPAEVERSLSTSDQYSTLISELIFGTDDRAAATEGRLIRSEQSIELAGIPLTLIAESRVASIDTALSAVTRVLWVGIPSLLALAAALAYLAAGRALRPVQSITTQVEKIRSAQSNDRIPEPASTDEISTLATTMNAMLDRLQSTADGQRRFISDASHELRTPAAVIRAEVEAAMADPANDWTATGRSVLDEQERLSGLVDDLILLARMEEGPTLATDEIDFDHLVQAEATRGWPTPMQTKTIAPMRITGDATQLTRAVRNLLANASRHAETQVQISLERAGEQGILWVDDDGAGVPATARDEVFERFTRLDEARQRDSGGAGLGLAIVREVARAHGGTASVTNSPLGGARFEIALPLT